MFLFCFQKPKQNKKDKEKGKGIPGMTCIIKWWCNKQWQQMQWKKVLEEEKGKHKENEMGKKEVIATIEEKKKIRWI